MYIGLHVKYHLSCQALMKLEFSEQISEKYSNTKFNENPSSWKTFYADGQTDMTEPAVTFRNFENEHKVC